MLVVLLIDVIVVFSLVRTARRTVEDALPLFCFYLTLMPIESRFVIPGLFDLGTDRVAIITLLVLFLQRGRKKSQRLLPLKRMIYLHIVWLVCSTAYSISVSTSIKQFIGQVVEYYVLYYIFCRLISDSRTVRNIIYGMVAAVCVASFFGVIEAYTRWSVLTIFPSNLWIRYSGPGPLYIEWGRGLRIRSTFPHPILLGDAIAMAVPMVFYLISQEPSRMRRWCLWIGSVLMFWALYKTSSRGPWLATGLSCVLLLLLVRSRVRRYVAVIGLLAVLVVSTRPGVWNTITNLYDSTQSSNNPVGSSYEYRDVLLHTVRAAVGRDSTRALLGYGLGTFREKGLEITFLGETRRWYTCDDNWALFLYETGYGGLIIIAGLLAGPLWMTLRQYQKLPRSHKYLSAIFFIVLLEFYFGLLSVAGYSWGQQGFMAWIVISLSIAYPRVVQREAKARSMVRPELVPLAQMNTALA